ncbi:MAG TPA: cation diffusion facilitator family transporter, partial [Bacteroidia bacterium]|nr:cation diffusion facilitator family transporter [Bacteroidia bacterium]
VKELEGIINERFRNRVEFFIHTDPCLPASCPICTVSDCPVRQEPFRERLDWNLRILLKNEPHRG